MTEPFDARNLRDAFGCFMTGVTVVTCLDEEGTPFGFTANSFASVSMDPPLLLVSIANTSANLETFSKGSGFAINILSENQTEVSNTFARPSDDRFASLYWCKGPVGSPLLANVSAWFDCTLEKAIEAGDHTILLGRIGAFEANTLPGLGYYRGAYVTPAQTTGQMPTGPDVVVSAIVQHEGKVLLIDDGHGGETLPMARVGSRGIQNTIEALLSEYKVEASVGSVYSVYEDGSQGSQTIAIRCPASADTTASGVFVDLDATSVEVSDQAVRHMLDRLSEEAKSGSYGVYFGNSKEGRVNHANVG